MTCPADDETRARMAAIGRKGAWALNARLSPEERSASASRAVAARWAAENARREAQGLPATKKWQPELDGDDLDAWLEELDSSMPEARLWPHEKRRRQAVLLMKKAIADAAVDAWKRAER
ncbi:hypothetical protein [Agrococcus beijingensis]|uniref:hypothetical protein n=1 Tax=Agrococcus beijingensis TaxID=3068634 RepID=UPI0027406F2A|nr:hypothetical protein [Agrococcus sp. REN33]